MQFDYVIVGAGSAGCVLASRLSEDPRNAVVLLEAGGRDSDPWIHVPGGYYRHLYHPELSWGFETEPEPGLGGRKMIWPRGRVLGGSSAINAMVYIRGQPPDYDRWRQLGLRGWGWSDVLPYFRRAEDQARGADAFHGAGGPLGVSDPRFRHRLCDAFIAAGIQAGLPANYDFNGPSQEGIGYFQHTIRRGRRCSSAAAYLRSAERRSNLLVCTGALATRILIEERRATGVAFMDADGVAHEVRASREVILAAGAIKSPHLLLLSGIGPSVQLRAHGISIVHDLPGVGAGLQDHLQVKLVYRVGGCRTYNEVMRSPTLKFLEGVRYAFGRRGVLASGPAVAGGFARSDPALDLPDIQFHFMPLSGDRPGHMHPFPGCTPIVSQLRPESRGELRLRSPDPMDQPAMHANYLDAETDRRVVVAGMRMTRRIMAQTAMQALDVSPHAPAADLETDDELLAFARETGYTQFHPTCTCRMGNDADAVVDDVLRVRGIEGLRVADASVMPAVVSGNTNAACIMIGEKASDLIAGRTAAA